MVNGVGAPSLPGPGAVPGLTRTADVALGGVRDLGAAALGRVAELGRGAPEALRQVAAPPAADVRAAAQAVRAEAKEAGGAARADARELRAEGRELGRSVRAEAKEARADAKELAHAARAEAKDARGEARGSADPARADAREARADDRGFGQATRAEAREVRADARDQTQAVRADGRDAGRTVRDAVAAAQQTRAEAREFGQAARAAAADTAATARTLGSELRGAAQTLRSLAADTAGAARRGVPETLAPPVGRPVDAGVRGRPAGGDLPPAPVRGPAAAPEAGPRIVLTAGRADAAGTNRPTAQPAGVAGDARPAAGAAREAPGQPVVRLGEGAARPASDPVRVQLAAIRDALALAALAGAATGRPGAPGAPVGPDPATRLPAQGAAALAADTPLPLRDAPGAAVQAIGREAGGREGLERALALALAAHAEVGAEAADAAELAAALRRLPGELAVYRDPWTGEQVALSGAATEEDRAAQAAAQERDDYGVRFFGPANRDEYRPGRAALAPPDAPMAAALPPGGVGARALGWDGAPAPARAALDGATMFKVEPDGAWVPQYRL